MTIISEIDLVKRIKKQITKFELKPEDVGFCKPLIADIEI